MTTKHGFTRQAKGDDPIRPEGLHNYFRIALWKGQTPNPVPGFHIPVFVSRIVTDGRVLAALAAQFAFEEKTTLSGIKATAAISEKPANVALTPRGFVGARNLVS
jgi:hypothetical protein